MMRSPFLRGANRVMKKIIQDGLNFTLFNYCISYSAVHFRASFIESNVNDNAQLAPTPRSAEGEV